MKLLLFTDDARVGFALATVFSVFSATAFLAGWKPEGYSFAAFALYLAAGAAWVRRRPPRRSK